MKNKFDIAVSTPCHNRRSPLFGSHAYGALNADSDVDLLVIMPTRNSLDQALKIRLAIPALFPLDLLVRTPETLK